MGSSMRQLAVVTGASSGIGLELARLCAQSNFDVIIAADEPSIHNAATGLSLSGVNITPVQCDLSTEEGVKRLYTAVESTGRPVDALLANAGLGLGGAFLDQDIREALRVVHTNIDGTICLVHLIARSMRERQRGRILITGSIAGFLPGSPHAVYDGTGAFLDSFSDALSSELKGTGVTVTCLLSGATDTKFFARAGMLEAQGDAQEQADPIDVAETGFEAMMKGEPSVVHGLKNKLRVAAARLARSPLP